MKDLSLFLMDIVQNSIRAGATNVEVKIKEEHASDRLEMKILDNGCGMNPVQIEQALDPFYTTRSTRKVGLGLPMLKMMAQMSGGDLSVQSTAGTGTTLQCWFKARHIDRPVWGDLGSTIGLLITGNPEIDFDFLLEFNDKEFAVSTKELVECIGTRSDLSHVKIAGFITDMMKENINEIGFE